jgi:hypothetical protein
MRPNTKRPTRTRRPTVLSSLRAVVSSDLPRATLLCRIHHLLPLPPLSNFIRELTVAPHLLQSPLDILKHPRPPAPRAHTATAAGQAATSFPTPKALPLCPRSHRCNLQKSDPRAGLMADAFIKCQCAEEYFGLVGGHL